jgi:F0F1-type ATP synthase assembly protein I
LINASQDSEEEGVVDDRSAMAKALDKVSLIISACLAMAVPVIAGWWLDQKFNTGVVLTLIGFGFGLIAGGWLLYRLVKQLEASAASGDPNDD